MPIYHSVTELIGRTPLLELCNYERNHDCLLYTSDAADEL